MLVVKDVKQYACKFLIYRRMKLFCTVYGNWFEPVRQFIQKLLSVNQYKLNYSVGN